MTTALFSKKSAAFTAGILAAVLLCVTLLALPHKTDAAMVNGDMHGYAWSDTIGWISLNCKEGGAGGADICATSNYKVTVASDNFTGYAWSDNVGWVSFKAADVAFCGGLSPTLNDATGDISGWVRVLSAPTSTAANGCISLRGSGYGLHYDSATASPYYPSYKKITGYAWGDLVVGWTDFSYAALDGATTSSGLWVGRTSYPDQSVIPGTHHMQVGEFWIKNLSLTESVGLTTLTIKMSAAGAPMTNFTNFKLALDGVPVTASFVPIGGDRYTVNVVPKLLTTGMVGNSTTADIYADFGGATSGTFFTELYAQGNGVSTSVGVNSGAPVTGQNMTIIPSLPPSTLNFRVNGVSSYMFTTAAGGPANFSWAAATNITGCTAVVDTIDPSETYWRSTSPSPITLPTGWTGPVTIPANSSTTTAHHVYGLNCTSTSGPVTATVAVDVPGVVPHVDLKVNGVNGPISMPYGGAVSLSWDSGDVTSCSVDSGTTGAPYTTDPGLWPSGASRTNNQPLPPGFVIITPSPAGTYTYGIKCNASTGIVRDHVDITITPLPAGTTGGGGTGPGPGGRPPWREI